MPVIYPTQGGTFVTIGSGISATTAAPPGGWVVVHPSSYTTQVYGNGPANGYYIDHVRLYVLGEVLALQSELMEDLLENRNAKLKCQARSLHEGYCVWDEAEGR